MIKEKRTEIGDVRINEITKKMQICVDSSYSAAIDTQWWADYDTELLRACKQGHTTEIQEDGLSKDPKKDYYIHPKHEEVSGSVQRGITLRFIIKSINLLMASERMRHNGPQTIEIYQKYIVPALDLLDDAARELDKIGENQKW